MSLWLSNIPILLQSLRENDWYITAFPFSFNRHDYVVVFEDLRELDRGSKYYSVNLTFIDMADEARTFKTYANAYGFNCKQDEIYDFFGIEPFTNNHYCLQNLCNIFNASMPNSLHHPEPEYTPFILQTIERHTNNEGLCCYAAKHNGKAADGRQKLRSAINTSKTKLLRPSLYEKIGGDETISFCYRKVGSIKDSEIISKLK